MPNFIKRWLERRPPEAGPLCPLPKPLALDGCRRALAFAPHPDDESLGCGGTLALLARRCPVKVVLVTDGDGLPPGAAKARRQEFADALAVLGVADYECWDYPDGDFHDGPSFQARAAALLDAFAPDWVLFPSPLDYHRDHLELSLAVRRACAGRPLWQIHYEVWSPLPATHYVDISAVMEQKLGALDCHRTAMQAGPYRAAVAGLNAYRGLYAMDRRETPRQAEAFCVDADGTLGAALAGLARRLRGA
jgi:LmbE family N-acetylglucosaminyl deacetylase